MFPAHSKPWWLALLDSELTAPAATRFHRDRSLRVLHRLLAGCGLHASLPELHEACGGTLTPSAAAAEFARRGRGARPVSVGLRELSQLSLPTLVMLNGEALLLSKVSPRAIAVVDDDGNEREIPKRTVRPWLPAVALDLAPERLARGGLLQRVRSALSRERSMVSRALLLASGSLLLGLVPPFIMQRVFDSALPDGRAGMLSALLWAVLLLGFYRQWLEWLRSRTLLGLEHRLGSTLSRSAFVHFVGFPLCGANSQRIGSALQALANIASVAALSSSVFAIALDLVSLLAYGVLLALSQPALALLAAVVLFVTFAMAMTFGRRMARLERDFSDASEAQTAQLFEILSGVVTFKSAGAERLAGAKWLSQLLRVKANVLAQERERLGFSGWVSALQVGTRISLLAAAAIACLNGNAGVGTYLAAAMFLDACLGAGARLVQSAVELLRARATLQQVDGLLAEKSAGIPVSKRALARTVTQQRSAAVAIEDVWFRYGSQAPWVVRSQSLQLGYGEFHELSTPSGSGKSTLLRLIAGLLEPERGAIYIHGIQAGAARDKVVYLPQEPCLLSGSILSNLKTLSGAPQDVILESLRATGLDRWIASLPMGVETWVSAGGHNFSGGQRQLILLAAAVASRKPVLLLDEAFAHIDRLTRGELDLKALFAGKTVISVTHDRG